MPATDGAGPGPALLTSHEPLTARYDCALLDLDGVVYVDDEAVPDVPAVLAAARDRGLTLAFVTNNASRTPESVAARLRDLGVPAEPSDVVTSAQAAARELLHLVPLGSRVLVLGDVGLVTAVEERGFRAVFSSADDPAAVVQGFGPEVNWRELAGAAAAIRNGAIWVATNTDLTIPTKDGPAPGNGALVEALATAVGAGPAVVAGKPFRPLFDESVERVGGKHPLVVGDRLDTDIEGARNSGADSLLVMTGVTDLEAAGRAQPAERPTYVAWTLHGLLTSHVSPQRLEDGRWSLGRWSARVDDEILRFDTVGADRDEGLRVFVATAWAAWDADPNHQLRLDAAIDTLQSIG